MKTAFALTHAAARDLEEILEYVARQGGESAYARVRDRLHEALVLLARRPYIGHARPDLTSASVRFWPVWSYMVVYRPASSPIEVQRVIHGARDLRALLRDL